MKPVASWLCNTDFFLGKGNEEINKSQAYCTDEKWSCGLLRILAVCKIMKSGKIKEKYFGTLKE